MAINIIIHAGAPKAGSSAIQKALSESSSRLKVLGYYYPEHKLDKNGVSSGHVQSVYDRLEDGSLILNRAKIQELIELAVLNECTTLILSSEFFYARMIELFRVFQNVKFVLYLRDPLAVFESNYNQSIKRHFKSELLHLPTKLPMNGLKLLERSLSSLGANFFVIRPYDYIIASEGDVVGDFFNLLGIQSALISQPKKINESYCYEALELMRWLNKQEVSIQERNEFDVTLQSFREGTISYSFIPKIKAQDYKRQVINELNALYDMHKIEEIKDLIHSIKDAQNKTYINQEVELPNFTGLFKYIGRKDKIMFRKLSRLSQQGSHISNTLISLQGNIILSYPIDALTSIWRIARGRFKRIAKTLLNR